MSYHDFLLSKQYKIEQAGFDISCDDYELFDFQQLVCEWALKRGRSCLFAGTGMGKTRMQLTYADQIIKQTNKPALIVTPLAVGHQFVKEGNAINVESEQIKESKLAYDKKAYIINYQRLHKIDLSDFDCLILDESSILKNEKAKFRNKLIEASKQIPYRLAATATPSPNDYMELGNHSEFAGILSYTDMLSSFFTHDGSETQKWRLKGHAESRFWEWVSKWALMFTSPEHLGFNGDKYVLPELDYKYHTVNIDYNNTSNGMLFPMQAVTMSERQQARRDSVQSRCEYAANLLSKDNKPHVVWCNLNYESKLIKELTDCVEITGSDSDEKKEDILIGFSEGYINRIVTKPSICGFGMNWQHCHNTTFVGLNDSYEQVYQAVKRFHRFGQKNSVTANFIIAENEGNVAANIRRKELQANNMLNNMIKYMKNISCNVESSQRLGSSYNATQNINLPK